MKAKILIDCGVQVATHLDGDGEPIFESEFLKKGTEIEFDLLGHPLIKVLPNEFKENTSIWNVQFPNGGLASLLRQWFQIID